MGLDRDSNLPDSGVKRKGQILPMDIYACTTFNTVKLRYPIKMASDVAQTGHYYSWWRRKKIYESLGVQNSDQLFG